MESEVRKLSAPAGESLDEVLHLIGRDQALMRVIGGRVSSERFEGGEVVAGDPGGTALVERVGPVAKLQSERAVFSCRGRRRAPSPREVQAATARIEHALEDRVGKLQLAPQLVDRIRCVGLDVCHGSMGARKKRLPRARPRHHPTGQRRPTLPRDIAQRNAALPRQCGQHLERGPRIPASPTAGPSHPPRYAVTQQVRRTT